MRKSPAPSFFCQTPAEVSETQKSIDAILQEADGLLTATHFKQKLCLYAQAVELGSITALVRLGDLYRNVFELRSEKINKYIANNKVKDFSKLDMTLTNNQQALEYYLKALQAADKLEGEAKHKIFDLNKNR